MNIIKYLLDWRYRHFYKKIRPMYKMIEDEKFSRFKTYQLKEEVRVEYDNEKSRLANTENKLKEKEKTIAEIGEDEYKRLEDEKVRAEVRIQRLKEEMDELTAKADGSRPTNEHPDGLHGNTQTIDKLYDLIDFVKEYINKL